MWRVPMCPFGVRSKFVRIDEGRLLDYYFDLSSLPLYPTMPGSIEHLGACHISPYHSVPANSPALCPAADNLFSVRGKVALVVS